MTLEKANYTSPTGALRASSNKVQFQQIPLDLLDGTARVFKVGETKYGRWNWRKGFPPYETLGSIFRHLKDVQLAIELEDRDGTKGALKDRESGEAHCHHLLCSVLILIDSLRRDEWEV